MPGRMAIILALLGGFNSACSTSASIERRNGPTVAGRIDASDANRLYLDAGEDERYWVDRSDIISIDHPGKVGMFVSAGLGAAGVGLLGISPFLNNDCISDCFSSQRGFAIFAGAAALISGLPVLLVNLRNHRRSVAAAEPARTGAPPPP